MSCAFRLRARRGNLFYSVDCSLAHCISADAKMGKGIAAKFRQNFAGIVEDVRAQNVPVGGVAVVDRKDGHYVYNLVTKARYFDLPTYEDLASSLIAMREHMERNCVASLAIPTLGCGLDKLKWSRVREIICDVFKDADNVLITVYFPLGAFQASCKIESKLPHSDNDEPGTGCCFEAQSQCPRVTPIYM